MKSIWLLSRRAAASARRRGSVGVAVGLLTATHISGLSACATGDGLRAHSEDAAILAKAGQTSPSTAANDFDKSAVLQAVKASVDGTVIDVAHVEGAARQFRVLATGASNNAGAIYEVSFVSTTTNAVARNYRVQRKAVVTPFFAEYGAVHLRYRLHEPAGSTWKVTREINFNPGRQALSCDDEGVCGVVADPFAVGAGAPALNAGLGILTAADQSHDRHRLALALGR